ncbi:MAG TPA: hypothetical protein VF838_05865 [Trebonia sp.]
MDGSGGAGPRDAAGVDDRVAVAVEELYGADPQAFTERRTELAAVARDAGDRAAAKAIGALRRPTRAAWVVNRLARSDPSAPASLSEMAAALRAAQQAGHGPRLRELSAARGALVDALTNRALSLAGVADAPPALRLEVSQTLTAALADPEVAADFAAGTLTRAVQWSGFGVLPEAGGGDGEAAEDEATVVPLGVVTGGRSAASGVRSGAGGTRTATKPTADQPGPVGTARRGRASAAQPSAEVVARRQAEEDERLAREAEERAARRREQYEEAERVVASTAAAAADTLAAEDRLEREVRELEERLTRARADLAGARMRARQAETAERRARQALDRISGS